MSWHAARTSTVALLVALILFPLYWAVISSFTPESKLFGAPDLVPSALVLDHYRAVFGERGLGMAIRNSLVVSGVTTLLCVPVGALCAYALARLHFRGRTLVLTAILAISMFPQISIVSPLYLLLRELRLID